MLDEQYMTPSEVCEYLNISRWTLNNLVRLGNFAPCLVITRKMKRWKKEDVDKWKRSNTK